MKIYKNGRVLVGDKFVQTDVAEESGKIVAIAQNLQGGEIVDCAGKYLLPALVDVHTHGAAGYDFNTASKSEMRKILDFYAQRGVGTVLPTVMTDSDEVICRQLSLIAELAEEYPQIKGINLEGPFLSPEKRGAMPLAMLQKPSEEKFALYQKAAKGKIRLLTVAPELPGALEFISHVANSVTVSIGHSNADGKTALKAVALGAKSFTHWGNAMSQIDRLELGVAGAGLLSEAYCEAITDGKHVAPENLQLLYKNKGDKMIAITDSMMAAGLGDGEYTLAGIDVTVKGGDAMLKGTNKRAGSTLDALSGLKNVISMLDLPLEKAIRLWTINPAKLLGLENEIGTIAVGKKAEFLLFE